MSKTLFYIELPPPTHGITYINRIIYDELNSKDEYEFHNVDFSSEISEIGRRSFSKVWSNINIILASWTAFIKTRPTQVYCVLSASMAGVLRELLLLLPSIILNKKRVLHLHGFTYYDIYKKSKLYQIVFNVLSSNAKLVVLCESQQQKTLDILGRKSYVLPNSLQQNIISLPKKIDVNENIKLLYISNISLSKGTLDLIESIRHIEGVTLTIAGSIWSEEEEFRSLIDSMTSRVTYVGFANEEKKQQLLNTHDVFCLPSRLSEGSPVSIIEALAYGLPVIGTDKGCIREMIKESGYAINGILDEVKMKKALKHIQMNYDKLSQTAIENYKKIYRKEVFINNLEGIVRAK